jgi:hypothetical protein
VTLVLYRRRALTIKAGGRTPSGRAFDKALASFGNNRQGVQEWHISELQTTRELAAGAERTGMLGEIHPAFSGDSWYSPAPKDRWGYVDGVPLSTCVPQGS